MTDAEKALVRKLEERTRCKFGFVDSNKTTGTLFSPEAVYDEDGDQIDAAYEMVYILDHPLKGFIPLEQIRQYPEIVQRDLFDLLQEKDPALMLGSNILLPWMLGNDLEDMLQKMLEYSKILDMGWHLGREDQFNDPFVPPPKAVPEEDEIWEDHFAEKKSEEGSAVIFYGDFIADGT